jgi:hypothetical protein
MWSGCMNSRVGERMFSCRVLKYHSTVHVNRSKTTEQQYKQCTYHNVTVRSHNVYTSSAILTAWYYLILRQRFLGDLNYTSNNKMYLGHSVKWLTFLPVFNHTRILVEVDTVKFQGNPSCGRGSDTRRQTDRRGEVRNTFFATYANAHKNVTS